MPPSLAAKGALYDTAGSATTSHGIGLPSRSVNQLLLSMFSCDGSGAPRHTWPGAWNKLAEVDSPGSAGLSFGWRKATNDANDALTITTPSEQAIAIMWAISGWDEVTAPEYATATGSSAAPDSPSLTVSWPQTANFWVSWFGMNGGGDAGSTPPGSYTEEEDFGTGGAGACKISTAWAQIGGTTQNPGAWADINQTWVAVTIGIRPLGGGSLIVPNLSEMMAILAR